MSPPDDIAAHDVTVTVPEQRELGNTAIEQSNARGFCRSIGDTARKSQGEGSCHAGHCRSIGAHC